MGYTKPTLTLHRGRRLMRPLIAWRLGAPLNATRSAKVPPQEAAPKASEPARAAETVGMSV